MGSLKFPHASGNSMSIAAPATNPNEDLELKLPATIGTAGQVLKNSSTAGTLEFGDDSAGKVLQIQYTSVAADNSNEQDNTTTDGSWVALTKPTLVITPAATSSKIMVQLNIYAGIDQNDSGTEIELAVRMLRSQSGQSDVIVGSGLWNMRAEHTASGGWTGANAMIQMLHVDTSFPNTNAITYSFTSQLEKDADSCRFHMGSSYSGNGTTLVATEFA